MKKLFFLIILLSSFLKTNAQYFSKDLLFGNNGVVINTSVLKNPIEVFFENNKYFFVLSENQICSFNFDGTKNLEFGSNGLLTFNTGNENYRIKGAKFHNGFIYLFGQLSINSNSNKNGFIVKLSSTGILDSTFGSGGIATFDFGHNEESINDIVFTSSNDIFSIGTRNYSIFLAKINISGILDNTFDSSGYKTYPMSANEYSNGINIFLTNNELVLSGSTVIGAKYLVLLKVNLNGDYIQNFGINGLKKIEVISQTDTSSLGLIKTIFKNDNLYFSYTKAYSFSTINNWLGKYNMINENTECEYISLPFSLPYFIVDENNEIYHTGIQRCSPNTSSNCSRDFFIKKTNTNGISDLTFNGTGVYNYNFFPNDLLSDDQSSVFYLHQDGSILIGGYSYNPMTSNGSGLSLVRLKETNLNIDTVNFEKSIIIYPNPSYSKIYIANNSQKTIQKILILDMSMKVVFEKHFPDQFIDISNFQNGIYFIQINVEGTSIHKKIIKI
ncbi:MAG: T9SS type A sorting domain-containing protein [Flavobacterium sp.]|jgi:hypothetical protein